MKVFAYSYRHFDEEPFFEKYCKELGIELGYTEKDPTLETAELARGYEYISILLTRVDAQLVEKFASMGVKVISNRLIGTDHVDVKRAKELGMTVTYAPYSSACVADYAVMLMLMSIRRMRQIIRRNEMNDFTLPGIQGKETRPAHRRLHGRAHPAPVRLRQRRGRAGHRQDRPHGDSRPERLRL